LRHRVRRCASTNTATVEENFSNVYRDIEAPEGQNEVDGGEKRVASRAKRASEFRHLCAPGS
jgi:hypothetical protein